jgi:hypothetical protein
VLVAALRSDNPLGGAPLTCDETAEHFTMHGLGEITLAKLLDLENRRQLVWADPVTREWVLETVAMRVRRAAAAKAAARAAEAAAAAATATAQEQALAGGVVRGGAGTLVFEPPESLSSGARRPAGVRAAQTRFEAPSDDGGRPRRVVWSEPPGDSAAPPTAPAGPTGGAPATTPPGAMAPVLAGVTAPTRRVDRRRALKEAQRHNSLVPARLASAPAITVAVLLAVLAVVVVLVAMHGGL